MVNCREPLGNCILQVTQSEKRRLHMRMGKRWIFRMDHFEEEFMIGHKSSRTQLILLLLYVISVYFDFLNMKIHNRYMTTMRMVNSTADNRKNNKKRRRNKTLSERPCEWASNVLVSSMQKQQRREDQNNSTADRRMKQVRTLRVNDSGKSRYYRVEHEIGNSAEFCLRCKIFRRFASNTQIDRKKEQIESFPEKEYRKDILQEKIKTNFSQ